MDGPAPNRLSPLASAAAAAWFTGGEIVPQEIGREAGVIIDVPTALHVPDVGTLSAREHQRRLDNPVRRTDAAWNEP